MESPFSRENIVRTYKAYRKLPLPELFQKIADALNGGDWDLWRIFENAASIAGELRRERNEARARLAEWEAMTPNRLRARADVIEEAEAEVAREVAIAEGMVAREAATTDDVPLVAG